MPPVCIPGRRCLSSNFVSNRQVLVIDFEPIRLKATEQLLQNAGFAVEIVGSSSELNTALAAGLPPVVVIEPMLPGHDGFALCRAMKRGGMGPAPNVIIAARIFRGQRYKAMAKDSGADLFLQRPDHDSLLVKVVAQMLGSTDGALPAGKKNWEEQLPDPMEHESPMSNAADTPAGSLDDFDWDQFDTQFEKAFDGLTGQKSPTADAGPTSRLDTGPEIGPLPSGPIGPSPKAFVFPTNLEPVPAEGLATLEKEPKKPPLRDSAASPSATVKLPRTALEQELPHSAAIAAPPAKRKPTLLIAAGIAVVVLAGGYVAMQFMSGRGESGQASAAAEEVLFQREPAPEAVTQPLETPGSPTSQPATQAATQAEVQPAAPAGAPAPPSESPASTTAPSLATPVPAKPQPIKTGPTALKPPPSDANFVGDARAEISVPRLATGSATKATPGTPSSAGQPSTVSSTTTESATKAAQEPAPAMQNAPAPPEVVRESESEPVEFVVMDDPLKADHSRDEPMVPEVGISTKPVVIPSSKAEPNFPQGARQARLGGQVTLNVTVKADGTVGDVRILSEPDARLGLGKAAVAAVKRWRYSPGTYKGNPVDTSQIVVLNFKP